MVWLVVEDLARAIQGAAVGGLRSAQLLGGVPCLLSIRRRPAASGGQPTTTRLQMMTELAPLMR